MRIRFLLVWVLVTLLAVFTAAQGPTLPFPQPTESCGAGSMWSLSTSAVLQSNSGTLSFSATVSSGQTVIALGGSTSIGGLAAGQKITGVSVNGGTCGTPFAVVTTETDAGATLVADIWAASNCPASTAETITFTPGATGVEIGQIYSVSGLACVITTDGTYVDTNTTSANPYIPPAITPAKTGDLIISNYNPFHGASAQNNAAWTWTNSGGSTELGLGYLTSNTAASGSPYTPSWTATAGKYSAVGVAFATH